MTFSQSQKARLILSSIEQEHSEAIETPRKRASIEIGIGRTKLSTLLNQRDACLKDKEKSKALDRAFTKRLALPGDASYQKFFEDVSNKLNRRDCEAVNHCLLDLAVDSWAPKALDASRPVGSRMRYGRLAELVMFEGPKILSAKPEALVERDVDGIEILGRRVMDTITDLLGAHPEAPDDFFDDRGHHAPSRAAKRLGYRIFRIRMESDRIGWQSRATFSDDQARTDLFIRAFNGDLHTDLIWLHRIIGADDIAWGNGAWNIAMHGADWETSAQYAADVLATFPLFLEESVMGLSAICEDYTMWPGVAAIVADRKCHALDGVRDKLAADRAQFQLMMESVDKMIPGIHAGLGYMDVLKIGEVK